MVQIWITKSELLVGGQACLGRAISPWSRSGWRHLLRLVVEDRASVSPRTLR
jgi:hypothetical protein